VHALYYSDPRLPSNYVLGAIPPLIADQDDHRAPPSFPIYRIPVPGLLADEWYYSEAPLMEVVGVQLCMDGQNCSGICLQYPNHRMALGQFRDDRDTSLYFHNPRFIALDCKENTSSVYITFSNGEHTAADNGKFQAMTGSIVWWYSTEKSKVVLLPTEVY
jgi:hypothetical protein